MSGSGFSRSQLNDVVRARFSSCPDAVIECVYSLLEGGAETVRWTHCLEKPYGRNRIFIHSPEYGLSWAEFLPDRSTSLHYHRTRREFFMVSAGLLELTISGSVTHLRPGEFAGSEPLLHHSLRNASQDWLRIAEIFTPALVDDKVRVFDSYRRKIGAVTHLE